MKVQNESTKAIWYFRLSIYISIHIPSIFSIR